jgi:hypothetical protein
MDWLSFTIPSRRGNRLVVRIVEIEYGKLRFTTILNVGIGIIVPASIEASDFPFNLEYSPNVTARVLKPGWGSAKVSKRKL